MQKCFYTNLSPRQRERLAYSAPKALRQKCVQNRVEPAVDKHQQEGGRLNQRTETVQASRCCKKQAKSFEPMFRRLQLVSRNTDHVRYM